MNKAIFITVRTGSTRLPKKCLKKINGRTTIEHLISRVKKSKLADKIILCTTILPEDDILCEIAQKNKILHIRGSVSDKLERWRKAAQKFQVEFFVTADGDDLFCEPELIDLAFKQYNADNPDFIEGKGLICGSFTYGIKTAALEKVCKIKDSENTEMMWVYFNQTGLFKTAELKNVPEIFKRPDIRMTLDYKEDFEFFKVIMEHFHNNGIEYYNLEDIVKFLDDNPEVRKINKHLQSKFLENQKRKTELKIKKEFKNDR